MKTDKMHVDYYSGIWLTDSCHNNPSALATVHDDLNSILILSFCRNLAMCDFWISEIGNSVTHLTWLVCLATSSISLKTL